MPVGKKSWLFPRMGKSELFSDGSIFCWISPTKYGRALSLCCNRIFQSAYLAFTPSPSITAIWRDGLRATADKLSHDWQLSGLTWYRHGISCLSVRPTCQLCQGQGAYYAHCELKQTRPCCLLLFFLKHVANYTSRMSTGKLRRPTVIDKILLTESERSEGHFIVNRKCIVKCQEHLHSWEN